MSLTAPKSPAVPLPHSATLPAQPKPWVLPVGRKVPPHEKRRASRFPHARPYRRTFRRRHHFPHSPFQGTESPRSQPRGPARAEHPPGPRAGPGRSRRCPGAAARRSRIAGGRTGRQGRCWRPGRTERARRAEPSRAPRAGRSPQDVAAPRLHCRLRELVSAAARGGSPFVLLPFLPHVFPFFSAFPRSFLGFSSTRGGRGLRNRCGTGSGGAGGQGSLHDPEAATPAPSCRGSGLLCRDHRSREMHRSMRTGKASSQVCEPLKPRRQNPERPGAAAVAVCACCRALAVQIEAFSSVKGGDAVCVPLKETGHRLHLKPRGIGTFHFHPPQRVLLLLGVDTALCSGAQVSHLSSFLRMFATAWSFPACTKAWVSRAPRV